MSTMTAHPSFNTTVVPARRSASLLPKKLMRSRPLFDREIVSRAVRASFVKLNPIALMKNPVMFVVETGAALTTLFLIRDIFVGGTRHRLFISDRAVALVHCAVCQLRRSYGGSARESSGGCAPKDPDGGAGKTAGIRRQNRPACPVRRCAVGDIVLCERAI